MSSVSPTHTNVSRSQGLMWAAAAAFVLSLMALIVGAPVAMSQGYSSVATIIYNGFSPLCHQIAERSFHFHGHAFAVCSRCTGIYAGFAAGVIFYPLVRSLRVTTSPRRIWLLLAAIPIGVDWFVGLMGWWANTQTSRFVTGALLGIVCAIFVVPGLMDVLTMDWRHFFGRTTLTPSPDQTRISPVSHDRTAPSDYSSPTTRI